MYFFYLLESQMEKIALVPGMMLKIRQTAFGDVTRVNVARLMSKISHPVWAASFLSFGPLVRQYHPQAHSDLRLKWW